MVDEGASKGKKVVGEGGERPREGFMKSARESGRREEARRKLRKERFPTLEPHFVTEEEAEEDALAQESLRACVRSPPPTQPASRSHSQMHTHKKIFRDKELESKHHRPTKVLKRFEDVSLENPEEMAEEIRVLRGQIDEENEEEKEEEKESEQKEKSDKVDDGGGGSGVVGYEEEVIDDDDNDDDMPADFNQEGQTEKPEYETTDGKNVDAEIPIDSYGWSKPVKPVPLQLYQNIKVKKCNEPKSGFRY
ncbi:hypothetical protein L1987_01856 [Smallanthus sonchifolius]|uniref:Uncharacterized protein n=1 Tax=Smallanthus sonchifolius TaxID=185202 RepID=A0ACB9K6A9_9ASTR|nr:hypothetical protein L1987_01856 [Smallanthus sonchifolius]